VKLSSCTATWNLILPPPTPTGPLYIFICISREKEEEEEMPPTQKKRGDTFKSRRGHLSWFFFFTMLRSPARCCSIENTQDFYIGRTRARAIVYWSFWKFKRREQKMIRCFGYIFFHPFFYRSTFHRDYMSVIFYSRLFFMICLLQFVMHLVVCNNMPKVYMYTTHKCLSVSRLTIFVCIFMLEKINKLFRLMARTQWIKYWS
jgi:hypothetical protein